MEIKEGELLVPWNKTRKVLQSSEFSLGFLDYGAKSMWKKGISSTETNGAKDYVWKNMPELGNDENGLV